MLTESERQARAVSDCELTAYVSVALIMQTYLLVLMCG